MQKVLFVICLVALLGVALPAQAQLRDHVQTETAPARLYDQGGPGFSLNQFFSPEHFRMSHSVEFSTSAFGGHSSSLGMYTNTMMWQFNQKLAARVDVAFAYSPTQSFGSVTGANQGKVFLRNAEIAYRPKENMRINLSIRQSPYGAYAGPYGAYGAYGAYGNGYSRFNTAFTTHSRDLFWNDNLR